MECHRPSKPFIGAIRVTVALFYHHSQINGPKTTRPDIDNLAKMAIDAMMGAAFFEDDNQVFQINFSKYLTTKPSYIQVTLEGEEQ